MKKSFGSSFSSQASLPVDDWEQQLKKIDQISQKYNKYHVFFKAHKQTLLKGFSPQIQETYQQMLNETIQDYRILPASLNYKVKSIVFKVFQIYFASLRHPQRQDFLVSIQSYFQQLQAHEEDSKINHEKKNANGNMKNQLEPIPEIMQNCTQTDSTILASKFAFIQHSPIDQLQYQFIRTYDWLKVLTSKQRGLFECSIEILMKFLAKFPSEDIAVCSFLQINLLLKVLARVKSHLNLAKSNQIMGSFLAALKQIINDPNEKQFHQKMSGELEQICQKLASHYKYQEGPGIQQINQEIYLLVPRFQFKLIFSAKIFKQRKQQGIKILEKCVLQWTRNPHQPKNASRTKYLSQQKLWNFLTDDKADFEIVVLAENLLKFLMGRHSNFQRGEFLNNYHEIFFRSLASKPENLRNLYFKTIGFQDMRNSNIVIGILLEVLEVIQENAEFYSQEFIGLIERISSMPMKQRSKKIIDLMLAISQRHSNIFKNPYLTHSASHAMKIFFEKFITIEIIHSQMTETYLELIRQLLQNLNPFIHQTCKFLFSKIQHTNHSAFLMAVTHLSRKKEAIDSLVKTISSSDQIYPELEFILKMIVTKIEPSFKTQFLQKILVPCLAIKDVFAEIVNGMSTDVCESTFNLVYGLLCNQRQIIIHPLSLEVLFYHANRQAVQKSLGIYKVSDDPKNLRFIDKILNLLQMPLENEILGSCAKIIANAFTCFTEDYERFGRNKCAQFMENLTKNIIEKIPMFANGQKPVLGYLYLMIELMNATQIHGTGRLKAHNALITSSLIKVKIYNGLTDFQTGALKVYEKMVPSNMTLYELLNKIAQKFKRDWHEIILENRSENLVLERQMNGCTLEQIRPLLETQLYAKKHKQFTLIKQTFIMLDGSMNPLFVQILKEIFAEVSKNGKMGNIQVKKFILKVTNSQVNLTDPKVTDMLRYYASKQTGLIDEEGFINFYKNACITLNGRQTAWKNLLTAKYRTDFSKTTEPIKHLADNQMFRFHIKNRPQIYQFLFELARQQNKKQGIIARQILSNLPVLEQNIGNQLSKDFLTNNKNIFQLNYRLVQIKHILDKEVNRKTPPKPKQQPKDPMEILKIQPDSSQQQQATGIARAQSEDQMPTRYEQPQKTRRMQIENSVQPKNKPNTRATSEPMYHQEDSAFTFIQNDSHMMKQEAQAQPSRLAETLYTEKLDIWLFAQIVEGQKGYQPDAQLCTSTCIHILRSLINFPSLTSDLLIKEQFPVDKMTVLLNQMRPLNLDQDQMVTFALLAEEQFTSQNFTLAEPLLALCLLSSRISWKRWLSESIFNSKKLVRIAALNFLIFYSIKYNFPINFFTVDVKLDPNRCIEWFTLLEFYLKHNLNSGFPFFDIVAKSFEYKLTTKVNQKTHIIIINGHLRLIQIIFSQNFHLVRQNAQAFQYLIRILHQITDNSIRLFLYEMLYDIDPVKTFKIMYQLIKAFKPEITVSEQKATFVGIKNLGTTCYMNSILQQFFMIQSFKKMILDFPLKNVPSETQVNGFLIVDDFLYQLQRMYIALQHSQKKSFYPKQFCLTIKDTQNRPINTSIQEDAHEFLNRLFGKIQKYCKDADRLKELQKIFLGKTVCEIICSECKQKLEKIEDFYHLSLEVKGTPNLMQSFNRFTAPQKIEDYKCEKCQKRNIIQKKTSLMQLPQMLIINLQRIIFDANLLTNVKVHSELEFAQIVDLGPLMHDSSQSKQSVFKLKGVVIHSGTSIGGHYYSIIKFGEDWYRFDDENVTKLDFDELKSLSYGGKFNNSVYDSVHSTNAYILFYEQQQRKGFNLGSAETVDEMDSMLRGQVNKATSNSLPDMQNISSDMTQKFINEVMQQNNFLYLQSQIHQPSFFDFLNKVYISQRCNQIFSNPEYSHFYQEWRLLSNTKNYEELYPIYLQMMRFFVHCHKLPDCVLKDTAQVLCELMYLMPQKTEYFFTNEVDQKYWIEVMCSHDDSRVREIHKVVMEKAILVFCNFFQFQLKPINHDGIESSLRSGQFTSIRRFQQILTFFISAVSSELVTRNVLKSNHFFAFLLTIIESDERIFKLAVQSTLLFDFLELLMGNQSPYAQKDKKRQDVPNYYTAPLIQGVTRLIKSRKNLVGSVLVNQRNASEDTFLALSEKEGQILSSVTFYKRMMRLKYDDGSLPLILAWMCYNDKSLSRLLGRFFLTCMNEMNEVDNIPALFNVFFCLRQNISTFLKIEDEHQVYRLECILGFSQMATHNKLNNQIVSYGLGFSSSTTVVRYYSAICFSEHDKLKPLLQLLYEKRTSITDFQTSGIITLLKLVAPFPVIITYLLSLPPPSYLHFDYLTWIGDYIEKNLPQKMQNISPISKSIILMKELYQIVLKKINQLVIKPSMPVMKHIIGINKNVQEVQVQIDEQVNYEIRVYAHETFILDNQPEKGGTNKSLPKSVFEDYKEKSYAFFFIEKPAIRHYNGEVDIKTKKTLTSIFISSIKPLLLNFTLPHFTHEITIPKGQSRINFEYTTQKLGNYLQVNILEEEIEIKQPAKPQGFAAYVNDNGVHRNGITVEDRIEDRKKSFVNCPTCTFENKPDTFKCEICESDIF